MPVMEPSPTRAPAPATGCRQPQGTEQDRDRFRAAFGKTAVEAGYLWYFDFDGDGDVDGHDNGQFNRRFGKS